MKKNICLMLLVALPCLGRGDEPIPNQRVDYPGFKKAVLESGPERKVRRISEEAFLAAMQQSNVVLLDARSRSHFTLRHIKGAVNLPFTEFGEASLAKQIPTKDTVVLIYCNNNFQGSPEAFFSKAPAASLNLSTYTSLKTYGYTNVYELGPLLEVKTTVLPFEGTEVDR